MVDLLLTFISFMDTYFALSSTLPQNIKVVKPENNLGIELIYSYIDYWSHGVDDLWNRER